MHVDLVLLAVQSFRKEPREAHKKKKAVALYMREEEHSEKNTYVCISIHVYGDVYTHSEGRRSQRMRSKNNVRESLPEGSREATHTHSGMQIKRGWVGCPK